MKAVALPFAALLVACGVHAHEVTWFENPNAFEFLNPMELYYDRDLVSLLFSPPFETFSIEPGEANESCIVEVEITKPDSPYLAIPNLKPAPARQVDVDVVLANLPLDDKPIGAFVKGRWRATGQPNPMECTAPWTDFIVPVEILRAPQWDVNYDAITEALRIFTGYKVGLQEACSVDGPYINIGFGTTFNLQVMSSYDSTRFYRGIRRIGGDLSGRIVDELGKPITGWKLDLPAGGLSTTVDSIGNFTLKSLPYGDNEIRFWSMVPFTDADTGMTRNQYVGLSIVVPSTQRFTSIDLTVKAAVYPVSGCVYTGWAAIGYGKLNQMDRFIYYAGGVGVPTGMSRRDAGLELSVIPPSGVSFTIRPGPREQNRMLDPVAGDWTLNEKFCNQLKPLTLRVPINF